MRDQEDKALNHGAVAESADAAKPGSAKPGSAQPGAAANKDEAKKLRKQSRCCS